jgi:hypothetical protein
MIALSVAGLLLFGLVPDRTDAWGGEVSPKTVAKNNDFSQSRRTFVVASILPLGVFQIKQPASADYGASSKMQLPNYIEFLEEKNKSVDTSRYLYQGDDQEVVLQRLREATVKLALIPSLAEQKKWSQVQGILTGPLGPLGMTMNQIASKSPPQVQVAAKKVKSSLIAIDQAAQKKSEAGCISATKVASEDLQAFMELAFLK